MAATQYAARFNRAFQRIWKLHGQPTLDIIDPVSGWTLDPGVTYDALQDQFVDGSNNSVSVDWSIQPATTVDYIPTRRNRDVTLTIGGVLPSDDIGRNIVLQWSSSVQSKVTACYGVGIGSSLYHVRSWEVYPEGTTAPVEIRLSLVGA